MAERTARERAQDVMALDGLDDSGFLIEYGDEALEAAIERAIQAAILDEREAIARMCDEIGATYDHVTGIGTHGNELIEIRSIAARIRARGEK